MHRWGMYLVAFCMALGLAGGQVWAQEAVTPRAARAADSRGRSSPEFRGHQPNHDARAGRPTRGGARARAAGSRGDPDPRPPKGPVGLGEEQPEIEVEVVGKKACEPTVPALAPSTGEVVTSINAAELEATGETQSRGRVGISARHHGHAPRPPV